MKLSQMVVDRTAAVEGEWEDYAAGIRFKIASYGSPEFKSAMYALMGDESLAGKSYGQWAAHAVHAAAKHLLTDWSGIDEEDNSGPMPYSAERSLAVLTDERYFDALNFVMVSAQARERSLRDRMGKALGN